MWQLTAEWHPDDLAYPQTGGSGFPVEYNEIPVLIYNNWFIRACGEEKSFLKIYIFKQGKTWKACPTRLRKINSFQTREYNQPTWNSKPIRRTWSSGNILTAVCGCTSNKTPKLESSPRLFPFRVEPVAKREATHFSDQIHNLSEWPIFHKSATNILCDFNIVFMYGDIFDKTNWNGFFGEKTTPYHSVAWLVLNNFQIFFSPSVVCLFWPCLWIIKFLDFSG